MSTKTYGTLAYMPGENSRSWLVHDKQMLRQSDSKLIIWHLSPGSMEYMGLQFFAFSVMLAILVYLCMVNTQFYAKLCCYAVQLSFFRMGR